MKHRPCCLCHHHQRYGITCAPVQNFESTMIKNIECLHKIVNHVLIGQFLLKCVISISSAWHLYETATVVAVEASEEWQKHLQQQHIVYSLQVVCNRCIVLALSEGQFSNLYFVLQEICCQSASSLCFSAHHQCQDRAVSQLKKKKARRFL